MSDPAHDDEYVREIAVGFEVPGGPAEIAWNLAAAAALGGPEPVDGALWRAEPAPEPGMVVRILTARFTDGRILLLAALRPTGAATHSEETISGAMISGERIEAVEDVLLSTEYDGAGLMRRIGIEAFAGDDVPMRVAGERRPIEGGAEVRPAGGGLGEATSYDRAALDLRSGGLAGVGLLETLRAA